MRVGARVVFAFCLSLLVACGVEQRDSSSSEPAAVEQESEAIAQAEELGQSAQAGAALGAPSGGVMPQVSCASHCNCPLGQQCAGGTCQTIIFPSPAPPTPPCMADCQCALRSYCNGANGGWGICIAPTCSVAWSYSPVPSGSTVNFLISSSQMPANSYLKLYGTRNGVVDENGTVYNLVSGTFPIPNAPGSSGVYTRYVRMYSPTNRLLCQSNTANVTFQ